MVKKVRQMRGPGMNLGLKKPRFGKFRDDGTPYGVTSGGKTATKSGGRKDYSKSSGNSYLSENLRKW